MHSTDILCTVWLLLLQVFDSQGAATDCQFYLTESESDHRQWDVYTSVDLAADTILSEYNNNNDLAILYTDGLEYGRSNSRTTTPLKNPLYQYSRNMTGSIRVADDVQMIVLGLGALSNELEWTECRERSDARRTLPTAGAATTYHNCTYRVPRTISAGHDFSQSSPVRTPKWLDRNGYCVDSIMVQPVSVRDNHERGAFAKRKVKKGSVITASPMLPLSRSHLDMVEEKTYQQLLLNYCFGSEMSSLLFLPLGPGVSQINHGPDPNVGIRWAKPDSLGNTVAAVLEAKEIPLAEYYALSTIRAGDELVLDYGTAWQTAWSHHVEKWEFRKQYNPALLPPHPKYRNAFDYQKLINRNPSRFLSLPNEYLETRCWIPSVGTLEKEGEYYVWSMPENMGFLNETVGCWVSSKLDNLYIVGLEADPDVFVNGLPPSAIVIEDRPYSTNQFLKQAFRHEIALPESMVLSSWKDLLADSSCGLYMAESAIPNSGLGMYSMKDINHLDRIFYGDVVIQAEDIPLNRKLRNWKAGNFDQLEGADWLLDNYYWDPTNSLAVFDAMDVQSIVPGLGMLANSHTGLVNAKERPATKYAELHRGRDPGAGASTSYFDVHFVAKGDIQAGEELYVQYGDDWFEDREEILGTIPLSYDFRQANALVKRLWKVYNNETLTHREIIDMGVDAIQMYGDPVWSRQRLLNAFPKNFMDFLKAVYVGTAALTVPNRVRSIEWLEQNGRCLDNIRPDLSTIRQAGRGAFATREIKKGSVIAPLPLVHLRREHMHIYGSDDYGDPRANVWREGTQLLMNYCYGHPESSLLFYPYSPVVNYVNHNLTHYNAEFQWSDLPNNKKDWLERTPDDLDSEDHAGLIMDMVATRDIDAGEEIFLNYGSQWERAWKLFVEEWNPSEHDKHYTSSTELNENYLWLKTEQEEDTDPYEIKNVEDLILSCFFKLPESSETEASPLKYMWKRSPFLFLSADDLHTCRVIDRQSKYEDITDRQDSIRRDAILYTVELVFDDEESDVVLVEGVPRHAIRFFEGEYLTDDFLRSAFRHEIHLPDAMIPKAWRDITKE